MASTTRKRDPAVYVKRIIENLKNPVFMARNGDLLLVSEIRRHNESGMAPEAIIECILNKREMIEQILFDFYMHREVERLEALFRKDAPKKPELIQ